MANKLKDKENVYTPKSAVKEEEHFVCPEPRTPVSKNQYKREVLTSPTRYTTPTKGIYQENCAEISRFKCDSYCCNEHTDFWR